MVIKKKNLRVHVCIPSPYPGSLLLSTADQQTSRGESFLLAASIFSPRAERHPLHSDITPVIVTHGFHRAKSKGLFSSFIFLKTDTEFHVIDEMFCYLFTVFSFSLITLQFPGWTPFPDFQIFESHSVQSSDSYFTYFPKWFQPGDLNTTYKCWWFLLHYLSSTFK